MLCQVFYIDIHGNGCVIYQNISYTQHGYELIYQSLTHLWTQLKLEKNNLYVLPYVLKKHMINIVYIIPLLSFIMVKWGIYEQIN